MSGEEAFRIAVVADMRRESLKAISAAWDRARVLVLQILGPLKLSNRLEFRSDQEACGRGWLVVWIHSSGQLPLFAQLEAVASDIEDASPETASVREVLKSYLAGIKDVMQQVRISGYELEDIAKRLPEAAQVSAAFGSCFGEDRRVRVACGTQHVDSFSLCALPGRHIHSSFHEVQFRVKMLGKHQMRATLLSTSRADLGVSRRDQTVFWDQDVVDGTKWRYLVNCLEKSAVVRAVVRKVVKASGTIGELLATDIRLGESIVDVDQLDGAERSEPAPLWTKSTLAGLGSEGPSGFYAPVATLAPNRERREVYPERA